MGTLAQPLSRRTKAIRFTATNHLVGYGWWAWVIPLKGEEVSIGIVFDQRLTDGDRTRFGKLEFPATQAPINGHIVRVSVQDEQLGLG